MENTKKMLNRLIECSHDLEYIEKNGLVNPKTLKVATAVLRVALQLIYEQIADLQKAANKSEAVENNMTIWRRQRRILNKLIAVSEIIPKIGFEEVFNRLSDCYHRICSCDGAYESIQLKIFEFFDIAPSVKERTNKVELDIQPPTILSEVF